MVALTRPLLLLPILLWFWVLCFADLCSVAQVWSVTSGALLDTLSSELPVSRLVFFKDFLLSASAAASCIHLWSLHYDSRHKPADHTPSGSAHVAIGRDAGEVFYVRHEKQTEVLSWSELKGQCEPVVTSCPLSWIWWTSVLLGPLCSPSLAVSLSSQRTLSVL